MSTQSAPQPPSREECIRNCRQALADGWAELWDQVRLHGVQAAAERVFYPGHPLGSVEAIAGWIESQRAGTAEAALPARDRHAGAGIRHRRA